MTTYETFVSEQRGGALLITWVCTACAEEHRVYLDPDQLESIAWLSTGHVALRQSSMISAAAQTAASAAPGLVTAVVWQITHTTGHAEQQRRESARARLTSVEHQHNFEMFNGTLRCSAPGCPDGDIISKARAAGIPLDNLLGIVGGDS